MPATLIGTTPEWGIDSAETGLIVESIDWDFQIKEKESLNIAGEPQGLSLYGDTAAVSLKGEIPTASPSALRLAGTLTLSNTTGDHFAAAPGAGLSRNVTKNVKIGHSREDFRKFEASSTIYPLISAS